MICFEDVHFLILCGLGVFEHDQIEDTLVIFLIVSVSSIEERGVIESVIQFLVHVYFNFIIEILADFVSSIMALGIIDVVEKYISLSWLNDSLLFLSPLLMLFIYFIEV